MYFPHLSTLQLVWLKSYLIISQNKWIFCENQQGIQNSKWMLGLQCEVLRRLQEISWLLLVCTEHLHATGESSSLASWFPYQHGFMCLKGNIVRLEWGNVQIMYMNMFCKIESVTDRPFSVTPLPTLRHTIDCVLLFSPVLVWKRRLHCTWCCGVPSKSLS